jgi:hypothetical protein
MIFSLVPWRGLLRACASFRKSLSLRAPSITATFQHRPHFHLVPSHSTLPTPPDKRVTRVELNSLLPGAPPPPLNAVNLAIWQRMLHCVETETTWYAPSNRPSTNNAALGNYSMQSLHLALTPRPLGSSLVGRCLVVRLPDSQKVTKSVAFWTSEHDMLFGFNGDLLIVGIVIFSRIFPLVLSPAVGEYLAME